MTTNSPQDQAIEHLQQLGLKEYEAKSFVALTRLPQGTAKEISAISEIPRTRVYDAVGGLESRGFVEIHHSKPKRFRAVSIAEAVETLRREYDERLDSIRETLGSLEPADGEEEPNDIYEVWSLSGKEAIVSRTQQLIDEADEEILLVIGEGVVFGDTLATRLEAAQARDVNVVVGTSSKASRDRVQTALPDAAVFVTDQTWLQSPARSGDDTQISRLMLIDRETILASTVKQDDGRNHEHAAVGQGFDNGFVAIARRLVVSGLRQGEGSETGEL